jgi:hypothetical protein
VARNGMSRPKLKNGGKAAQNGVTGALNACVTTYQAPQLERADG